MTERTAELVRLHTRWLDVPAEQRCALMRRRGPDLEVALRRAVELADGGHGWPEAVRLAMRDAAPPVSAPRPQKQASPGSFGP